MGMKLTAGIQEALLAILCYDDSPTGAKVIASLVPARSYDAYFRDIAEEAHEYLAKYKKAPGEHTLDIVDSLKSRNEEAAEIYTRIYRSLLNTKDEVNREYVVAKASEFYRRQRLKALHTNGIAALQSDKDDSLEEAEALIYNFSRNGQAGEAFDPGLLLNDPKQAMAFLHKEDEYFDTDISILDRYNLGPVRKGMHLFVAGPNKGKSWWLCHLGKASLKQRRRVLHVTCEMSKEQVAMRYIQSLFSISKRNSVIVYNRLQREGAKFTGLEPYELRNRPSFDLDDITHVLLKKFKKLEHRQPFWIKEFPTGQLTVNQLRAYLDMMEGRYSFIPDLLLLDYPDIMAVDAKNQRNDTARIYRELRGIAGERNNALAAVTQANREAERARKALIQGKNLSEDYSKFGTADSILTYNQTDEEYEMGLARLFNLKNRGDTKNHTLLLSQCYGVGQFHMDSVRMSNSDSKYWQLVGEQDGEDGMDEEE
jgi:replicative DNA helicase